MELEKRYQLPFPRERVYAAWVSSDTVIPPATAMDIDPRVGGHYRLIMDGPDFQGRNEGEFSRVEAGERVTYSWQWQGDEEKTEIDVTFAGSDDSTEVRIQHTGFLTEASAAQHDAGWDSYIEGFSVFLAADAD